MSLVSRHGESMSHSEYHRTETVSKSLRGLQLSLLSLLSPGRRERILLEFSQLLPGTPDETLQSCTKSLLGAARNMETDDQGGAVRIVQSLCALKGHVGSPEHVSVRGHRRRSGRTSETQEFFPVRQAESPLLRIDLPVLQVGSQAFAKPGFDESWTVRNGSWASSGS